MAQQTKTITSETLEAAYRALTPSQNGFTEDLMASNTIIPVLDLTSNAAGTNVPEYQAQALAYGNATAFQVASADVDVATTPGFYRLTGTGMVVSNTGSNQSVIISITDGVTPKTLWKLFVPSGLGVNSFFSLNFDYVIFVASGITLNVLATSTSSAAGSIRQVADVNGTIVNPTGFTPQ